MGSPERWEAVAEAIAARLTELGMSWTALYETKAISEPTMRAMRQGVPLQRSYKRTALTRALGWTPDSIDRLLAGQEPVLAEPAPGGPSYDQIAALPAALTDVEQRLAVLERRAIGDTAVATDEISISREGIAVSGKNADDVEELIQLLREGSPIEALVQRQDELAEELRELAAVVTSLTDAVKALQSARGSVEPG